jgi:SUKH-4 immunity protein
MTPTEIRELVMSRLPDHYDDLKLTFYRRDCREKGEYVVIGDDYGTELCVRLADGAIYSIDPRHKLPTRFMNSGIPQLASFIELTRLPSESPEADPEAVARQFRDRLARIDSKAFDKAENWWAVVLEQMSNGL